MVRRNWLCLMRLICLLELLCRPFQLRSGSRCFPGRANAGTLVENKLIDIKPIDFLIFFNAQWVRNKETNAFDNGRKRTDANA